MAYATVLSDADMRERAANALGHAPLFQHVSRRLLSDLVEKFDLRSIPPPPDDLFLAGVGPAVLVVLEGAIRTHGPSGTQTFGPGTYVRYDAALFHVEFSSKVAAVGTDFVRVFLLDTDEILTLPRMIVNALDRTELAAMNASL